MAAQQVERVYGSDCKVTDPRSGVKYDFNALRQPGDYEVCAHVFLMVSFSFGNSYEVCAHVFSKFSFSFW